MCLLQERASAARTRHEVLQPLAEERDGWRGRCAALEQLCEELANRLGAVLDNRDLFGETGEHRATAGLS